MRLQTIVRLFLCAVLLAQHAAVFAFETDQFNLPPQPLADIGDEASDYAEQNVRKAVDKINIEISARQSCLEKRAEKLERGNCDSAQAEHSRLKFLRSPEAVARRVYNLLGTGFPPLTKSGSWMENHRFKNQSARYKTSFEDSIYFGAPINYLTISSTVNLFDAQFGTDKIAHFFQQGYSYYKIYNRALASGLKPDEASEKAVRWGKLTERTYYGTLISGVYSNGDLCANYVGMKFYQGLTREIKIGDRIRPPVLLLKDGIWTFNESFDSRESLLKPFLSKHLNEALNPSIYISTLRYFVRRTVKRQSCGQWLGRFPNLSQIDLENASELLKLWNGEDYGFTDSKNFVTIANTCFGENEKPKAETTDSREKPPAHL